MTLFVPPVGDARIHVRWTFNRSAINDRRRSHCSVDLVAPPCCLVRRSGIRLHDSLLAIHCLRTGIPFPRRRDSRRMYRKFASARSAAPVLRQCRAVSAGSSSDPTFRSASHSCRTGRRMGYDSGHMATTGSTDSGSLSRRSVSRRSVFRRNVSRRNDRGPRPTGGSVSHEASK